MIPLSLRFPACLLAAMVGFAGLSLAGDIIKLKTGEKLDGLILSETPTEVKIEVQETKSIKTTKTVQRKDIAEIIKATPDQFEAADLALLVPAPDMMTDAAYQKVISEKLEPFLKKYPISRYKAEVEAILKTYKEEMDKAKSGAKKVEGSWVAPAEQEWNAYNFEARLQRVELAKLLKAGKTEEAYRLLAELETNKPASVETVTAVELFKAAIPNLERTLDRLALEQPIKLKNRTESLAALSKEDRKRTEEAIKQDEAELKQRLEEDKKAKLALQAYSEYDLKSITDAKAALVKETARLSKLDLAGTKTAATTFQTGLKNLHEKSYLAAQRNFEDAAKFFTKDSFVKERAEVAKKAAIEAARANAESAASKPTVTTPVPGAKPDDKAPASKTTEPAKTAGGAPVKKTPPPAAEKAAADEESTPEPEPSSNLSMLLIAGAAVLLILLLVVKMLAKKKAAADE